jgi:hypothetical protein
VKEKKKMMQRWISFFAVLVVFSVVYLSGCSDTPINAPGDQQLSTLGDATCAAGTTYDLMAGQNTNIGTLNVSNNQTHLIVTYTVTNPICTTGLEGLHLWVGTDLANVPKNGAGNLQLGHFPYSADANGASTYTFTIPFSELGITDVTQACLTNLYVVAHAVHCGETVFGGSNGVNIGDNGRWYYYGIHTICCDEGEPELPTCETAFGKGGYVWTFGNQSNPENLPSLNLNRNRWGWAINLTSPGQTTYQLWSGAGLNNTGNGTLVGNVTVNWDGFNAVVTYNVTSTGCNLTEAHLYAGDGRPTTVAPGQYGNTATFGPGVTTHTFNVPLEDTNNTDGVWLIAHSVVCCN